MHDVVVLIDREQGGAARMATNGLKLHAAFPITSLLDTLASPVLPDLTLFWGQDHHFKHRSGLCKSRPPSRIWSAGLV